MHVWYFFTLNHSGMFAEIDWMALQKKSSTSRHFLFYTNILAWPLLARICMLRVSVYQHRRLVEDVRTRVRIHSPIV